MRYVFGLLNGVIEASHFYDFICNDKYVAGKHFPYPETFELLNCSTKELDSAEMETNDSIEATTEDVHDGIVSNI